MIKIKFFEANMATIVLRFYLMMAVAIILGFLGLWTAMVLTTFPIFLTCILGARIMLALPGYKKTEKTHIPTGRMEIA